MSESIESTDDQYTELIKRGWVTFRTVAEHIAKVAGELNIMCSSINAIEKDLIQFRTNIITQSDVWNKKDVKKVKIPTKMDRRGGSEEQWMCPLGFAESLAELYVDSRFSFFEVISTKRKREEKDAARKAWKHDVLQRLEPDD